MDWTERRDRFRTLLDGDLCVHPGSVYDPISARIAEDLGFECGMFAGSVASLAVLGDPDLIVLTLSEFAEQAYRICRAGNLALMVDADHGYGNALNVKRTVEELETAGVSGLSIEDTDLPQPFGRLDGASLLSVEEGVGKMRAALAGRQDPRLAIVGRTSAVRIAGVEDTIRRLQAYQGAGVDALFAVGVKTQDELDAIAGAVSLPLILGGLPAPLQDRGRLAALGVRICLQSHAPFMAAVQATYRTLAALRAGTPPADLEGQPAKELMARLTRDAQYRDSMERFLA
jgi:carboxyvinyl-carboxyphosphonate phosphorylmutase